MLLDAHTRAGGRSPVLRPVVLIAVISTYTKQLSSLTNALLTYNPMRQREVQSIAPPLFSVAVLGQQTLQQLDYAIASLHVIHCILKRLSEMLPKQRPRLVVVRAVGTASF